jgi:MFS family permease
VPLVVACAMFMQNLDSTVIATALPTIARALDESPLRLNVAITCYLLSLAVFIPISGWTADRFGARRVFSTAIVVFTLGSIGCGCATSLPALVASRIVQGMGGAMMVPVGRLVLLRTVEKSDLVRAMSYVSVPALIGPVMGPPLGGFIVSYASWRWIFFINIPIGILGIVLVNLLVGDLKELGRRPFDFKGFALTGIGSRRWRSVLRMSDAAHCRPRRSSHCSSSAPAAPFFISLTLPVPSIRSSISP